MRKIDRDMGEMKATELKMAAGEAYLTGWARLVLMVSPAGEYHVVDGDREDGDPLADRPYTGLERIDIMKKQIFVPRMCTACPDPHVENCPRCFGYGLTLDGSPVSSHAAYGKQVIRWERCETCGGEPVVKS